MNCSVVNIKTLSFDWKNDPTYVYIGRPSIYGNPVKVGEKCKYCGKVHMTKGSTIPCYKIYLTEMLHNNIEFIEHLYRLKGKILVCFCKPMPCHGDILATYVNNMR